MLQNPPMKEEEAKHNLPDRTKVEKKNQAKIPFHPVEPSLRCKPEQGELQINNPVLMFY